MAKVITCPEPLPLMLDSFTIFLAGGIVGCENWQSKMIDLLKNQDMTLYNPRRPNFPIGDPKAAPEQIEWEFQALRRADVISFWFDSGTVQPIVMFEYGYWLSQSAIYGSRIFVGCHPEYPRRLDVEEQTRLLGQKSLPVAIIEIAYSLEQLAGQLIEHKGGR